MDEEKSFLSTLTGKEVEAENSMANVSGTSCGSTFTGGISPGHFTLVQNKQLATKIVVMSWSTNMDLLALVTSANELLVHRLNWQLLCSLEIEGDDEEE